MTFRNEPVSMWFDGRMVMRQSPIQGIGTFAIDPLRAGETVIWVSGGLVFSPQDWEDGLITIEPELYNQEQLGPDLFLINPKAYHYYLNHSCDPNLSFIHSGTRYQFVTLRAIQAQEELTLDYGMYGEAELAQCVCGSAHCRGQVTPEDWRLPAVQERYKGLFPLHIEQKIQQERAADLNDQANPSLHRNHTPLEGHSDGASSRTCG